MGHFERQYLPITITRTFVSLVSYIREFPLAVMSEVYCQSVPNATRFLLFLPREDAEYLCYTYLAVLEQCIIIVSKQHVSLTEGNSHESQFSARTRPGA